MQRAQGQPQDLVAVVTALALLRDDGRGQRVNLVELQAHG